MVTECENITKQSENRLKGEKYSEILSSKWQGNIFLITEKQ